MRNEENISINTELYKLGTPQQMESEIMGLWRNAVEDVSLYEKRASTLIAAAFQYLTYKRDAEGLELNEQVIQEFIVIKPLIKAAARQDVPIEYREPLQKYLITLPTIDESMFSLTQEEIDELVIGMKVTEHHTYCEMQVPEILSKLTKFEK